MKKRILGFTLIELLAVIFIIGVISVIAIPSINRATKQSREELYQIQIKNIKSGAKSWAASNFDVLPEGEDEIITLTLGQLKIGGFVDGDVTNPKTKKLFPNDMEITITKTTNNFEYLVLEETGSIIGEIDKNSPSITLNGLAHEIVEINTNYDEKGAIARDPSGGAIEDIDITIRSNNNIVPNVDATKLLQYKITYTATYNNVTATAIRTVTVKDTIPPILTIPSNTEINADDVPSFNFMEGVSATDNSLKTPTITISGNVSTLPGNYYVNYTATDESGNKTTKTRKITVLDTSAPKITILGDNPLNINMGSTYMDPGATAHDDVDGNLTNKIITTGIVNINIPGTYTVTYSVTDSRGNKVTATRMVHVMDSIPPTITFGTNGNATYAKTHNSKVTVSDNVGLNTSSLKYLWNTSTTQPSESSFTSSFTNGGTITSPADLTGGYYLWILAKDTAGNTTIKRSNIFNLDNTGPVITSITSNASDITQNSFTITRIGDATDAHSGLAIIPYRTLISTNGVFWSIICIDNATTSCNVTDLSESTTYYYRICVYDNLGNQTCTASKTTKTQEASSGFLMDKRDGKTYPWVKIGNQVWMAENLKYTGNGCLNKTYNSSSPYNACMANGTEIHYQWGAAMEGVCPPGWHIPTDNEWKTLEGTVDTTYKVGNEEWDKTGYRGNDVGKNLKATNANGTDNYGFSGLLSGYRSTSGTIGDVGASGYWWSSSLSGSNAWARRINFGTANDSRYIDSQAYGFSVRCIQDCLGC